MVQLCLLNRPMIICYGWSCTRDGENGLPQNLYTEWYWSGTLMAFARVCNLRCAKDTQWETQQIANRIDEDIRKIISYKLEIFKVCVT